MLKIAAFLLFFFAIAPGGISGADETEEPKKTIRVFLPGMEGGKAYLRGRDWLRLSSQQKIETVELARRGALELQTVIALPAEVYIRELDQMFLDNPDSREIEVGQAIQGVAIAFGDWDDGKDPQKTLERYLPPAEE